MNAHAFDKSEVLGRHVTEGTSRAPRRWYLHAVGGGREQIYQPAIIQNEDVQNEDVIDVNAIDEATGLHLGDARRAERKLKSTTTDRFRLSRVV